MRRGPKSNYTLEERIAIIRDYDSGHATLKEVAFKYGLNNPQMISVWRCRLLNSDKIVNFAPIDTVQQKKDEPMKDKSKEALEAELKELKKKLEWAELQNKALNTLIDIAEEQGIRIRKKSGAKQ